MKKALITGITGQDGFLLSKLLHELNYDITGLVRNIELMNPTVKKSLDGYRIRLVEIDISKLEKIEAFVNQNEFDEIYHLAAVSSVSFSLKNPTLTKEINYVFTINFVNTLIKNKKLNKFFFAASSEIFSTDVVPIKENNSLKSINPYGESKLQSYKILNQLKIDNNLFIVSGFLFNHFSKYSKDNFFIKKIIKGAVEIKYGKRDFLYVGNLDLIRDFGSAEDYVVAIYYMMQNTLPNDYIIATSVGTTLRAIVNYIFFKLELNIKSVIEKPEFMRRGEPYKIVGDYTKIRKELGWQPTKSLWKEIDDIIEDETNKYL